MKLQIDTNLKTIQIEESVSLGQFFDLMVSMFPDLAWKDYLLIPVEKIEYFKDPVIIPYNPQPWLPSIPGPYTPNVPWTWPIVTCGTQSCTHNLEIQF